MAQYAAERQRELRGCLDGNVAHSKCPPCLRTQRSQADTAVVGKPSHRHGRRGSTEQHAVHLAAHVIPGRQIGRPQHVADPSIEVLSALLGRARAQVPLPVLREPLRSERVAEEVEALLSGITQRGFGLVAGEPELCHRIAHPYQRLGGAAATEDDEITGIGDDKSTERFLRAALPKVLQEPVCVDVGKQ